MYKNECIANVFCKRDSNKIKKRLLRYELSLPSLHSSLFTSGPAGRLHKFLADIDKHTHTGFTGYDCFTSRPLARPKAELLYLVSVNSSFHPILSQQQTGVGREGNDPYVDHPYQAGEQAGRNCLNHLLITYRNEF